MVRRLKIFAPNRCSNMERVKHSDNHTAIQLVKSDTVQETKAEGRGGEDETAGLVFYTSSAGDGGIALSYMRHSKQSHGPWHDTCLL